MLLEQYGPEVWPMQPGHPEGRRQRNIHCTRGQDVARCLLHLRIMRQKPRRPELFVPRRTAELHDLRCLTKHISRPFVICHCTTRESTHGHSVNNSFSRVENNPPCIDSRLLYFVAAVRIPIYCLTHKPQRQKNKYFRNIFHIFLFAAPGNKAIEKTHWRVVVDDKIWKRERERETFVMLARN